MPHLLDVDGDMCHHAHNVTGKFLKPFEKRVEQLCTDLHTEMYGELICMVIYWRFVKWILLIILCLQIMCLRLLSVLDAVDINVDHLLVLTVLYYSWVKKDLKNV